MMNKHLDLVKSFHEKFNVPVLSDPDGSIESARSKFRHKLMLEEVNEYLEGSDSGDVYSVAKELSDILYAVYEVFQEVHRSHMSKDYSEFKMIKGDNYSKADIRNIF